MRKLEKPEFTLAGNSRFMTICKFIFEHYEDFCKTIFPKGLAKSGYLPLFYPTAEYDYYFYRLRRAQYYQEARKENWTYVVEPLISFKQFATHFKAPEVNETLSRLRLFINVLENIFNSSIVYNGKYRRFSRYSDYFHEDLKTIIPLYINGAEEFTHDDLFDFRKYDYGHEIDYRPVYCYFLTLMKQKKLDIYYRPIYSDFSNMLYKDHRDWTSYQIKKILSAKTDLGASIFSEAEEQKYKEMMTEADEKKLLKNIKIPQIVEAYYQVFHRLPENYPPVQEESEENE